MVCGEEREVWMWCVVKSGVEVMYGDERGVWRW